MRRRRRPDRLEPPRALAFTDTDQGTLDPHAHVGMDPALRDRIARCRITGTDPPLEGRLR
jgi:hypothetical protein